MMKNKTMKTLLALSLALPTFSALAGGDGPPAVEQCPAISYPAVNAHTPALQVDGEQIKDTDGRVVLLRGINTSGDSKVPDFMPLTDAAMLDPLAGWGINTLRLLFTWEAYEPNRCDYETAYMQYYEQVVEWAAERNLYVIVDFHQDAYSRYTINGCGEGFPKWSVFSEISPAEPDNSEACEGWGTEMIFNLDHHKAWEHFHKDTELAKTRYIDMVTNVAEHMAKHPNVIGYELINEPWGNDTELANFYNAVGPAIRSRHPDAILFVPPHALVSSGLFGNNIAKPSFDNMVYSPHYYDAGVILNSNWGGGDISGPLNGMADKAEQWGVPMLLGEYGGPAETTNIEGYMDAMNEWLNDGMHHGTQWNYTPTWRADIKDGWNGEDLSIVDDNGNLRPNFRPRAYPVATAGQPISFSESSTSLSYSWQHDSSKGSTDIYLPAGFLTGKQLITVGVSCTAASNLLSCSSLNNGAASVVVE
jgi:endoglycosylceramidase